MRRTGIVIRVKQSDRVAYPSGSILKVYRHGGSVVEGTSPDGQPIVRQLIVDDGVIVPSEAQSEIFVVLRTQGDRLVILDAVPVKAGQFVVDRPFNVLYKDVLQKLTH